MPVLILWGVPRQAGVHPRRAPRRNLARPGALRQFFAVLLHGRHTLVRFSAPLSCANWCMAAARRCGGTALRKVSRVLRVHFRRQREMAIGPDLFPPQHAGRGDPAVAIPLRPRSPPMRHA